MTMMRKRNLDHDLESGGGKGGGGPTTSGAPSHPSPLYAHSSPSHLPLIPPTPPSRSTVCYLALLSVLLASYIGFTSVSNSSLREDLLAAERSYANLHAQQKSAHAKEIDALTGANTELGGQVKRNEENLASIKSLLAERDADVRDRSERITGLEDELAKAKRDLDDEKAHVDTVEGELDHMTEKKGNLEKEKEELEEKVSTLEAENAVLKAKLEEAGREKQAVEKKKKEKRSSDALVSDAAKDKAMPYRKDGDSENASGDASANEPDGDGVHGYPKLPQHRDDWGGESDEANESLTKPRSDGSIDENEDEGEVTGGSKVRDDEGTDGGSDKASGKDDEGGAFLEADTAKGAADAADLDLKKIRDEEKAAAALAADAAQSKGGLEDSNEDEGKQKMVDTPDETAKTDVQATPSESGKRKESDDDDDDDNAEDDDDDNTDSGEFDETKDVEKDTYLGGNDQTPAVKLARRTNDPFAQVGDSPVNDGNEGAKAASASQDGSDANRQDSRGKDLSENVGINTASQDEDESGTKNNKAQSKPMSRKGIRENAKSKALALDSDNPADDAAASKAIKGEDDESETMKDKSKGEKRNGEIELDGIPAQGDSSNTVINADADDGKSDRAADDHIVKEDRDKKKTKLPAEETEKNLTKRKESDDIGITAAVVKETK